MKSFGDMVKTAQKMQRLMTELNEALDAELMPAESAGGGLVEVVVNGHGELKQVRIQPDALKDGELLEDLILTATKNAQAAAKVHKEKATEKITGGFGMPF
jgi:nucleoid-associated protein EbfC